MVATQNSDGNAKLRVGEGIEPACGEGADDAGPCKLTQPRKNDGDPRRCSHKGPSTRNRDTNRGRVKSFKLSKKRKKDNQDSLSDIDDAEIVGYFNTKEEINYKRILWEAINQKYTEAKKQKRTTETKKGVSVKKAATTTERVELQKPSSKINYDALKLLDDELNQGSETAQTVGAESSYAHRTKDSPYGDVSHLGSDEGSDNEDEHDISYSKDNGTFGHLGSDYEYGDEHLDDEYFDF